MKKFLVATVVAVAALNLVGCASVSMGNAEQDAAVKKFAAPAADRSALYIYRNESMGGSVKMDVSVDGKPIGQTASKTFLYKEVAPGRHTVASTAENTDTLTVDTQPGMSYYIWQEVKMGVMYARNKLQLVDVTTGKKGVQETSLAVTK